MLTIQHASMMNGNLMMFTGGQQAGVQPDAKPAPACSEHPVSNAVADTARSQGQHLCCICKEYDGGPGSDFVVWTA